MKLIDSFLYSQCKVFGMLSERLSNEAGVKRKKDWAAKLSVMMRQPSHPLYVPPVAEPAPPPPDGGEDAADEVSTQPLAAHTIVAAWLRFSHRSHVQETVLQEAAEAKNETPTKSPASKFKAAVGVIGLVGEGGGSSGPDTPESLAVADPGTASQDLSGTWVYAAETLSGNPSQSAFRLFESADLFSALNLICLLCLDVCCSPSQRLALAVQVAELALRLNLLQAMTSFSARRLA